MWNKSKSVMLSKIIVKLLFLGLTASVFTLPWLVKGYIEISGKNQNIFTPLLITLYISLIPAFAALLSLNKLLNNIESLNIFDRNNIKQLRILSWCCFSISIIYGIFGFYYLISLLIAFAAVFFGINLRIIKNVIAQAMIIKEENDFTI